MNSTVDLKREFKRLFRGMDFVSRHAALNRRGKEGERFAEVYQQLGLLWEFLALQCPHRAGWRKAREGKFTCKLCGTLRGANERWLLLLRVGKKVVGRKAFPNSKETFPNKKAATVVNDTIQFHGATLTVDVHNSYRSRLFRGSKLDIAVGETLPIKQRPTREKLTLMVLVLKMVVELLDRKCRSEADDENS